MSKNNVRLANFVRKVRVQKQIEQYFGETHIISEVKNDLQNNHQVIEKLQHGVALVNEWLNQEYYSSKEARLAQVAILDLEAICLDIIAIITMRCSLKPMTMVSVASMCANRLGMADQGEAIQTAAELIAILCDTDLLDLDRPTKYAQVVVKSRVQLDGELKEKAVYSQFLPPMIHRPHVLKNNRHSGYSTLRGDSIILGGYQNHHDDHVSLDVLNTLNRNQFEIDEEFISTVEEQPSATVAERLDNWEENYEHLSKAERDMMRLEQENWETYKKQCYFTYSLMLRHGNKFYVQHKMDKRGRIYTYGYHINPQGNSFKKAMLNLAHKEVATGVEDFLGECR